MPRETWELFMVLQESRISLTSLCSCYSYLTFLHPRTCCYFCCCWCFSLSHTHKHTYTHPTPSSLLFQGLVSIRKPWTVIYPHSSNVLPRPQVQVIWTWELGISLLLLLTDLQEELPRRWSLRGNFGGSCCSGLVLVLRWIGT